MYRSRPSRRRYPILKSSAPDNSLPCIYIYCYKPHTASSSSRQPCCCLSLCNPCSGLIWIHSLHYNQSKSSSRISDKVSALMWFRPGSPPSADLCREPSYTDRSLNTHSQPPSPVYTPCCNCSNNPRRFRNFSSPQHSSRFSSSCSNPQVLACWSNSLRSFHTNRRRTHR